MLLLRNVEAELRRLDPDRVEARLLAEHEHAVGGDELCRVRLDRRRVVELRRNGARLAAEERLADERLPRLERRAGKVPDALRYLARPLELQVRVHAVERAERERDLRKARVAGALAHAVDRAVDPCRARVDGGHGSGGGEAEVVVAVPVDRYVDPAAHLIDQVRSRLRCRDAEGVDDHRLARARLDGGLVHALEKAQVGARAVDAEVRDRDVVLDGEGDGLADAFEHHVGLHAVRLQLQV